MKIIIFYWITSRMIQIPNSRSINNRIKTRILNDCKLVSILIGLKSINRILYFALQENFNRNAIISRYQTVACTAVLAFWQCQLYPSWFVRNSCESTPINRLIHVCQPAIRVKEIKFQIIYKRARSIHFFFTTNIYLLHRAWHQRKFLYKIECEE